MDILRRVSKAVDAQRDRWDDNFDGLTPEDVAIINSELARAVTNPWIFDHACDPKDTVCLFTDATNQRMGYVYFDNQEGKHPQHGQTVFPPGLAAQHIFVQEMAAAIWYTRMIVNTRQLKQTRIHVGVDNSAAAYALRHMYSSNTVVNGWLVELQKLLVETGNSLEIFQVTSRDNPADDPSRAQWQLDPERLKRGVEAYRGFLKGLRSGSNPECFPDAALRHPLDDVTILDMCHTVDFDCAELRTTRDGDAYFASSALAS
jgi:hypothetical protein